MDTPGYKRKDLDFESVLQTELTGNRNKTLTSKINDLDLSDLNPTVYRDLTNYSYRLDKNNVDIDVEEAEYASEQIRYQGIAEGINNEFERMSTVIK